MSNIYSSIDELIGNTPLIELGAYSKAVGSKARIIAKLESFNPAGSAKDRIAKNILEKAEEQGILKPGATIIEPTSGNTGIGLAMMARVKGYSLILTMPESMSEERRNLLKAYGAKLVLTPASEGMQGAINKANQLAAETVDSFIPAQFDNPANPEIHKATTGPEIWRDTDGNVDIFVAGVGTGGTVTGVGQFLKKQNPNIQVVAVEPADSPLLSGGDAGSHPIQGIGANFIPTILDTGIYNQVIPVTGEDAFSAGRKLAETEGILAGISSGAALHAATKLALDEQNAGKTIVVLLPDTGERYLSTSLFKNE